MRPLAVDIDGTLTRPRPDRGVDPRVFDALRAYAAEAPVVVATGKAFPFPVALCEFIDIPKRVIAENGGVTLCETDSGDDPYGGGDSDGITYNGDPTAAEAVADAYREAGYELGWGEPDLVNYWRETELAVARDQPLSPLTAIAAHHGLEVVDTGYAYHVKSPAIDKDTGLESVAASLDRDPEAFVAVGDSENDVSTFDRADRSFAVANADDAARAAADVVTDGAHAAGFLEALDAVRSE